MVEKPGASCRDSRELLTISIGIGGRLAHDLGTAHTAVPWYMGAAPMRSSGHTVDRHGDRLEEVQ